MINVVEYFPLPREQQQRVLDRVHQARQNGALRSEAESGVSAAWALRQFEYACARFTQMRADYGPGGRESRREVRRHLERLVAALRELRSASDLVKTLISDDLYGAPDVLIRD